ncbi:ABC transporter ATP-binding protein [Aquibacillus koreensis]|uniref:ABC transporter ATP-binding protein n=2 Tax=Aquibacillus koreensis TaxID=279446 RepID=A0A9X3WGH2_9BACI|nr:ABC transporter ATP-binding protein [Aquibacillus koreensis]MCT2535040.1 ABC transporter ATP-binding protein [Aquibacillus koreensis]MDC3419327.1 ABC transporter ATP-binding protein [Aquibacillus koreensis]
MGYGKVNVLKDLNLDIKEQSTCAIIGPSGCGKSTLLYGIAGIMQPSSGQLLIHDQPVKENRKETGVILQHYGLLPWKTVWKNAALGLKLRGVPKQVIEEKVSDVLRKLHIYELRDKYPVQLSGGQRQRVAVARVLAIEPDLLLMDEPFSSLDAIARESLQDLLLNIFNNSKLTIVFVTHNIEEAVFLGQKIVIMDQGSKNISHVLKNDLFGDQTLRNKPDFYRLCTDVRHSLQEKTTSL